MSQVSAATRLLLRNLRHPIVLLRWLSRDSGDLVARLAAMTNDELEAFAGEARRSSARTDRAPKRR